MDLKRNIYWKVIFASLFIQLILLFIKSFLTETSIDYLSLFIITFIFYITISVIIKINIIYRILSSGTARIAYIIFTIYIIYIQYSKGIGFISFTMSSLIIILVFYTLVAILPSDTKITKDLLHYTKTIIFLPYFRGLELLKTYFATSLNNTHWRNRLREYEKNNESNDY